MDDFIYIIALIAWVVFAFYRKSQKKSEASREAAQKAQSPEEPRTIHTLEDILRGIQDKPEEEPEPSYVSPTLSDGMSPVLGETLFEKEYNRRGITSIEEMDTPYSHEDSKPIEIEVDEVVLEEGDKEDWREKIDLRKAVIYSEILNSPYI